MILYLFTKKSQNIHGFRESLKSKGKFAILL